MGRTHGFECADGGNVFRGSTGLFIFHAVPMNPIGNKCCLLGKKIMPKKPRISYDLLIEPSRSMTS